MPLKPSDEDSPTEKLPPGLFADTAASEKTLSRLHEIFLLSGSTIPHADFDQVLNSLLIQSPDPDMMLKNLFRFVEASVSKSSLLNDLFRYSPLSDLAARIFGHSQYFSDILVRDPELFRWLTATGVLESPMPTSYLPAETDRIRMTFSNPRRLLDAIRRLYRREVLRIGARDILGKADLRETTKELSDLADAIIDATDSLVAEELKATYGSVPGTPFCVIGLGKLGGQELNYSSDIDVIFLYGEEGTFRGFDRREHTYHEYFVKRAERIVQVLTESTAEGHLYRVDTRLRPEGGAGPLARSLQSYLAYYESRGDLWERQMLIKARAAGGDRKLGGEFIRQISPFVYPRTHFSHPAESVARIKARIEAELHTDDNIKLRPGGIRDIEFAVQTLQLLHGGKDTEVRGANTLEGIGKLRRRDYFSGEEEKDLTAAYVLFRTLEHRLQIVLNTQTHRIPAGQPQRKALARRLGFEDEVKMMTRLQGHFARVREIFTGVLTSGERPGPGPDFLMDGGMDQPESMLEQYHLADRRRALRNLRSLLTGSGLTQARRLDGRSTDAFRLILETLLREIGESAVPDMTLNNLAILGGAQSFPEQFYHQLRDPAFRALVIRVCSVSPPLVKGLVQHPTLLDEIASGIRLPLKGEGDWSPVELKNREEVRAGILNTLKVLSFDEMTGQLTALADRIAAGIADVCIGRRRAKSPLAIFALGKYGTGELSFGGDLDLLFLTSVEKQTAKEKVETQVQEFVRGMTEVSHEGVLYDVDARLRPEGKNAPLVTDFSAYVKYLSSRASLWERQSLTRLRFVWGDETLAKRVLAEVSKFVYETPLPDDWITSIVRMRRAMETRSRTSRGDYLDLKLGPGGMVDVEFLAQMLQLHCGKERDTFRGNMQTVTMLVNAPGSLLHPDISRRLVEAYRVFREVEKLIRLTLEEKSTILPEEEKLETLARCHNGSTGQELKDTISSTMKRVRQYFLETSERIGRADQ